MRTRFKCIYGRKNRGFTLLEVLVAVVILSVGLLGLAALQTRGQQFSFSAHARTQATILAYDLMDRIRANDNPLDPSISIALSQANGYHQAGTLSKDCSATPCSPTELRDYDVTQWQTRIASALPSGEGEITWNNDVVGYDITIRWALRDIEKNNPNAINEKRSLTWTMLP